MHKFYIKKYYLLDNFKKKYIDKLDNNTIIIFRNYTKKNFIEDIKKLKFYCKKRGIKVLLSNNIKLALKLKLDGFYIPSFNKSFSHLSYKIRKNFLIVGSAHNLKEIKIKEKQKVQEIFLSSLFKKNKNFLGFNKFLIKKKITKKKIIALGGISRNNFKRFQLINCLGFGGISYFEQKKRPYF